MTLDDGRDGNRHHTGAGVGSAMTGDAIPPVWLVWRDLAQRLRRQALLILGLPLLVGIFSLVSPRRPAQIYQARLSVAVDIPRSAIVVGSDEGTAAKIGEALIDDLARIIGGDVFAAAVARHLPPGTEVAAGEIASSLSATDRHRIADITVRRALPARVPADEVAKVERQLLAIAQAVVEELNAHGADWFARLGEDEVVLSVIDSPRVERLPASLTERLQQPLRLLLALLIGLGLAAWREAIDLAIRNAEQAALAVAAPVLGVIPGQRRSRWGT